MFNTYIVILHNYIYNYIVRHSRISNCLSTIDNRHLTVTNQSLSGFTIRIFLFGSIPDKIEISEKWKIIVIHNRYIFVEPWIPLNVDDLIVFHAAAIEMTYIDQPIPSPPKLPAFETANLLSPLTYMNHSICTEAVGMTGNRVNNYVQIATIASTVSKL